MHVTVRDKKHLDPEVAMDWWGWVIVAVVAVLLLTTLAVLIQRRRRRGGVIGLGDSSRRDRR